MAELFLNSVGFPVRNGTLSRNRDESDVWNWSVAEAAGLILFPPGAWPLLKCRVDAAAAALAYEAAAKLPPAKPWPAAFADEDEEAVAWATRYQEFQRTACFLGPYRAERATQARLLRDMIGNPFRF